MFTFGDYLDTRIDKIILRHDIDFSLDCAVAIAQADKEMGIRSSFFFMLTSNMYNLLSSDSADKVKKISDMGHRISLHFDPTAHSDMEYGFSIEKDTFERLFGEELEIISLHRPGKFLNNNNKRLRGVRHTYEDEFFKNMKYLSDSAGRDCRIEWDDTLKQAKKDKLSIQLLLHPVWWADSNISVTEALRNVLHQKAEFLITETTKNCKSFQPNT